MLRWGFRHLSWALPDGPAWRWRAVNRTTGDIRLIADAVVVHAEDSLHHWLNLTLAAGAALVVFGVLVAMLGGWRRRDT